MNTASIIRTVKPAIVKNASIFKNAAVSWLSQNKKELLIGSGLASMLTSTILAVHATPKACRLIDQYTSDHDGAKPTKVETVKLTWKLYLPAVATAGLGIAGVIGAGYLARKESAMLTAAYTLSQEQLGDYKKALLESEDAKKIEDSISKSEVERKPYEASNVIDTGKGDDLFFDPYCGRYFRSDAEEIKKELNELNHSFLLDQTVTLNDIYEWMNLEVTELGDYVMYDVSEGLIELALSSKLTVNDEPCVVFHINNEPRFSTTGETFC